MSQSYRNFQPRLHLHTTGGLPVTLHTIYEMCAFLWNHQQADPCYILAAPDVIAVISSSVLGTSYSLPPMLGPNMLPYRISRLINPATGSEMRIIASTQGLPNPVPGSFALLDQDAKPLLLCLAVDLEETNGLTYT